MSAAPPPVAAGAFLHQAPDASRRQLLDDLARLLAYPGPHFAPMGVATLARLEVAHPRAAEALRRYLAAAAPLEGFELEELYTRTFDLDPVCALEVGWHLYGEQYERGEFLARMRALVAGVGLAENGELPDHLTSVLPVVGRLARSDAERFAVTYLRPALARMIAGVAGRDNPCEDLLRAVALLLLDEVPVPPPPPVGNHGPQGGAR